jgi:predicted helicase
METQAIVAKLARCARAVEGYPQHIVQAAFFGAFCARQFANGDFSPATTWQMLAESSQELAEHASIAQTPQFAAAVKLLASIPQQTIDPHRYEQFLECFDSEQRKRLGVWFTPAEIAKYMVAIVDQALRDHLNIANGLANTGVCVIDPCCGTGTFHEAVFRRIADEAVNPAEAIKDAIPRVWGMEISLPPLIAARLRLSRLLDEYGIQDTLRLYHLDALTGWVFGQMSMDAPRPQEFSAVVIIGNPPFYGFAAPQDALKYEGSGGRGVNDPYARFFALAEQIVTNPYTQFPFHDAILHAGQGVVCFIANNIWLDGLSHLEMRKQWTQAFPFMQIDNLNGDKFRTGKRTPAGEQDPSAFVTEHNPEGVQVGVAIALACTNTHTPGVQYRDLWGTQKVQVLKSMNGPNYQNLTPVPAQGMLLKPCDVTKRFWDWPAIPDLFASSFSGVRSGRDHGLLTIDRETLVERMMAYFDSAISHEQMAELSPTLMRPGHAYDPIVAREQLWDVGFDPANIVRFNYRPFDRRWCYHEPRYGLLHGTSPGQPHICSDNWGMIVQQRSRRGWSPPFLTKNLFCLTLFDMGANWFPLWLYDDAGALFAEETLKCSNLTPAGHEYCNRLGIEALDLMHHCFAVQYAPAYVNEYKHALEQGWPRIPLPENRDVLMASAALGAKIVRLLDLDCPISCTNGDLAVLCCQEEYSSLLLKTWGYLTAQHTVMPGRGTIDERDGSLDIYLNTTTWWRNVPVDVWAFQIGGYRVLKKWLSYRDVTVYGKPIDSGEFVELVCRLASIITFFPKLSLNFQLVSSN